MALPPEHNIKPYFESRKGAFDQFIDTVYWACYGIVTLFLVMSFNAEIDSRTVARSIPENAVVTRLFQAKTKNHPLYVSVQFQSADSSHVLCSVDVPLEHRPDGIEIGRLIRIVRTSRHCDVPLLVDYLASVGDPLKFALGIVVLGLGLFFLRRFRAERRKMNACSSHGQARRISSGCVL